ncbi:MAG: hypothetical protein NTZ60_10715 [Campylobacterales bacterium]|nr:hypothetical protein [Campylobacterales bacterium]
MKKESYELFKNGDLLTIAEVIETELKTRNESPFWADKIVPFTKAILSVLLPLRDKEMLFTPEGEKADELTPELFLKFNDLVSLKTLAFTIKKSNEAGTLLRTKYESSTCQRYEIIELEVLNAYLSRCNINVENEFLDFPISSYNLHQGVSNVIKSLL